MLTGTETCSQERETQNFILFVAPKAAHISPLATWARRLDSTPFQQFPRSSLPTGTLPVSVEIYRFAVMADKTVFRPAKLTDISLAYDDAVFVHPAAYDAVVGFTAEDSSKKRGGALLTLTNMSAQGQQSYFYVKCVSI